MRMHYVERDMRKAERREKAEAKAKHRRQMKQIDKLLAQARKLLRATVGAA